MRKDRDVRIPIERVRPIVQRLVAERDYESGEGQYAGGKTRLGFEVGISERQLYCIDRSEYTTISMSVVDRILTKTGNQHLWYISPENGGLADFYSDNPPVFKQPRKKRGGPKFCDGCGDRVRLSNKSGKCGKCYLEAKRKDFRCADCGIEIHHESTRCSPCYFNHRKKIGSSPAASGWNKGAARLFIPTG